MAKTLSKGPKLNINKLRAKAEDKVASLQEIRESAIALQKDRETIDRCISSLKDSNIDEEDLRIVNKYLDEGIEEKEKALNDELEEWEKANEELQEVVKDIQQEENELDDQTTNLKNAELTTGEDNLKNAASEAEYKKRELNEAEKQYVEQLNLSIQQLECQMRDMRNKSICSR